MSDRLRELTKLSAQEHATLSAAQCQVLRAMSDHAPSGRLRFTVDLGSGRVDVEPEAPMPEQDDDAR